MALKKKIRIPSICVGVLMVFLGESFTDQQAVYGSLSQEEGLAQVATFVPLVKRLSRSYRAEPRLVLAVMKAESGFNPSAVSSAGALGLMQLMPKTALGQYAKVESRKFDPEFFKRQLLDQPDLNILLGARHLDRLEKAFRRVTDPKKRQMLVLASYNVGFERMKEAFGCTRLACISTQANQLTRAGFQAELSTLPRETRLYVKVVQQNYRQLPASM